MWPWKPTHLLTVSSRVNDVILNLEYFQTHKRLENVLSVWARSCWCPNSYTQHTSPSGEVWWPEKSPRSASAAGKWFEANWNIQKCKFLLLPPQDHSLLEHISRSMFFPGCWSFCEPCQHTHAISPVYICIAQVSQYIKGGSTFNRRRCKYLLIGNSRWSGLSMSIGRVLYYVPREMGDRAYIKWGARAGAQYTTTKTSMSD